MYMYMLPLSVWQLVTRLIPCPTACFLVHVHVQGKRLPRMQNIAGSSPARGNSSFSLEKRSCLRVSLLAFTLSL